MHDSNLSVTYNSNTSYTVKEFHFLAVRVITVHKLPNISRNGCTNKVNESLYEIARKQHASFM